MEFLWMKGIEPPHYPALEGDISTDVLVIGGGMAGVLCARLLHDRGVNCILAEARAIGSGVTKGTTAVLSAQHDTLYTDLVKQFGEMRAKQYLDANLQAVERFRAFAADIPCDFDEKPSFMYDTTDAKKLEREAETVRRLGFPAEFTTDTNLPFEIAGAIRYPGMAQFHPLKFLYGIANGLPIYENTFVRNVEGNIAYTDGGKITARKIVIASHFPFINSHGLYFMKLYQRRSFVIALENAPDLAGTYVGTSVKDLYFRNYGDLLLVGGGDRRTGVNTRGFEAVRAFIRQYLPNVRGKYAWATQDCMSLDGVPYIGAYSPSTPDLYVVSGFNEWGMTSSMAAADILADLVTGKKNEYAQTFAPNRSMLHAQLFANLGETLCNFVRPTAKRCPHLGCALKWNPDERTWDCPCHGSRFDAHGKLIDNPAMRDAKV